MAQQVRVDPLADPGRPGDLADDLPDPLPGQNVRHRSGASLPAGEQRTRAATIKVELQELSKLAADRHLPPSAALAAADDDHALGEADVLDPHLDQLGDPRPGLEQRLQHEPGPTALGVGLVDEPQLLLEEQPVDAAAAVRGCGEPGFLPGGFEHRLALRVVDTFASEDGGDGGRRYVRGRP